MKQDVIDPAVVTPLVAPDPKALAFGLVARSYPLADHYPKA
jgi:hypothetical protein